jgi:RNA processing factor Prp31
MPDIELFNIPKSELYYKKEELEDEIFSLSNRLKRIKNSEKVQEIKEQIIFLVNSIKKIDNRMSQLYM